MTRDEARQLIEAYKNFPSTKLFRLKPINYPIFYLLECYAKGWQINYLDHEHIGIRRVVNWDLDFDALLKSHEIWRYVAINPELTNTVLGFVQEDLFCRYIGRCNPLKPTGTSWTFLPFEVVKYKDPYVTWKEFFVNPFSQPYFRGRFQNHIKYYQIEIDLNTTDIIGKWNQKVPFHYLQQTIDWKPWRGEIRWEGD